MSAPAALAKVVAENIHNAAFDLVRAVNCLKQGPRPDLVEEAADLASGAAKALKEAARLQRSIQDPQRGKLIVFP